MREQRERVAKTKSFKTVKNQFLRRLTYFLGAIKL